MGESSAFNQARKQGQPRRAPPRTWMCRKQQRRVVLALVRLLEPDHVYDVCGRRDISDLHEGVVQTIKRREQVQVARHEDDEEERAP